MESSIALYGKNPLEIVSSDLIKNASNEVHTAQVYLGSNIFVNKYGVLGFSIIDSKPKKRWVRYDRSDWTGVEHGEDIYDTVILNDPVRMRHFADTDKGFAAARQFIFPEEVYDFFTRENFLGDPLINKCCSDKTMPSDFDEERMIYNPFENTYHTLMEYVVLKENERRVQAGFTNLTGDHTNAYISFHPWSVYHSVINQLDKGIMQSLNNFDILLNKFDMCNIVPKKDLEVILAKQQQLLS